ncbi:MAG: ammonium transporter [Gammaproteobacteria bacterium]|nr:MAG: ammonium transporter [Gammaproteobacteria bacterium]
MEAIEGIKNLSYALDTFYFLITGALVMWMAAVMATNINKRPDGSCYSGISGFFFQMVFVASAMSMIIQFKMKKLLGAHSRRPASRVTRPSLYSGIVVAVLAGLPMLVFGEEAAAAAEAVPTLDSGDTAWMLTSTALVLFMTIPGLALFYAGMVRAKNVLSVMVQCFAITALVTILWVVYGYSLAFGDGGSMQQWIGGLGKSFMDGAGVDTLLDGGTIPESVFSMFQLTFAIITPALVVGAFAERMKFSAMLWFMGLWVTFVYAPIAHWVWGGGWLSDMGVLDFAGGTVVHINAGVAALVAALVLGKRKGYPKTSMAPNNMVLTVVGASMLWVGWFGFNAGSALAADGIAGMAMAVTQIATATAALSWMFFEWVSHGKPSALGLVSGAVAGLVAITPASGFVGPIGALAIGVAAGVGCYIAAVKVKRVLGYDDSLDCFGVHAIGGIIGALLTGVFVSKGLGGVGFAEGVTMGAQLGKQFIGVIVTIIYTATVSFIILKIVDVIVGLRVTEEQETEGLDIALHDERGYNL